MGNFKTSEIAFHLSELHQRYIEFRKKVTTILATLRNKKRAEERKRKAAETIKSANKVRIKQEPGTNNTVISSATDVTVTGPQPTSPPQPVRSQSTAPQVQSVTNYYPPTTYGPRYNQVVQPGPLLPTSAHFPPNAIPQQYTSYTVTTTYHMPAMPQSIGYQASATLWPNRSGRGHRR